MDSGTLCIPDQNYTTCNEELQALNWQIASITNDRNSLNDTLNLQRVRVLASSVNLNWVGCGDIDQSSCTGQNPSISAPELNSFAAECASSVSVCYAGYLKINWTSTQPLHLYVQFAISTGTATTTSNSGTTGNTLVPYPGGSALTNGDMISNFQNDACTYDVQDNPLHCPSGSLTYNATYVY